MFGRLSPPLERNRSITFSDGKDMKKSRNLQEISGLFYKTVSKKQKRRAVHHIYALYLWRFNLAGASRGVSPLRDSTLYQRSYSILDFILEAAHSTA